MKQEMLKDKIGTVSIIPYINNRPAIASSATVTITKPAGDAIVTDATATVNATTGEISYDLAALSNTILGENFQARWTYTISATAYYQTTLFDVVLNKLAICAVDDDLLNEQSDIMDRNESYSGTVGSSGNTSLVDNNLKNYVDDFWNGGRVIAEDPSTGLEQVRTITDFVQSTGTLTLTPAWSANPTSSYTYSVKRGFQKKIETAFEEMMLDVRSRGFRPALILESSELKRPLIKKALSLIYMDYMVEPNDKSAILSDKYAQQYIDLLSKVDFQYDRDQSGTISGDAEKDQQPGSLRMRR